MSAKKSGSSKKRAARGAKVATETIAGSKVEVFEKDGREHVLIDGRPHRVRKSGDSYWLEANMYDKPQPTAMDAAKQFIKAESKRSSG